MAPWSTQTGDLSQQTADLLITLVCAVVVTVHAWDRYNTPDSNRVSTTRSAFLFTGAGYVSASLILFLLLSEVALRPGVLPRGVLVFLEIEGIQEILKNYCAPPVLAAVILTVLLPHTPILSSADDWLLGRFQAWGSIPQGVRNLAGELDAAGASVGAGRRRGFAAVDRGGRGGSQRLAKIVSADPPETPRGSVTRVLRIYRALQQLQTLEAASGYQSAFYSRQDAWQVIKDDFRVFLAELQAFFVLFEQLTPIEGSASEEALAKAKNAIATFAARCTAT